MKLGEDYSFQDDYKTETVAIKLLSGPYKDVIFRFVNLKVIEAEDKSYATMNYSYDIIKTPSLSETTLRKDTRFETHLGLVLNSLILDAAEMIENQVKIKDSNGTSRESNSTESIEE